MLCSKGTKTCVHVCVNSKICPRDLILGLPLNMGKGRNEVGKGMVKRRDERQKRGLGQGGGIGGRRKGGSKEGRTGPAVSKFLKALPGVSVRRIRKEGVRMEGERSTSLKVHWSLT
jgi:hypothetical protein